MITMEVEGPFIVRAGVVLGRVGTLAVALVPHFTRFAKTLTRHPNRRINPCHACQRLQLRQPGRRVERCGG